MSDTSNQDTSNPGTSGESRPGPSGEQADWVRRVLGLDAGGVGQDGGPADVIAGWRDACERFAATAAAAWQGLETLRAKMRDDPEWQALADFSLDGTDIAFDALWRALPVPWPSDPTAARGAHETVMRAIAAFEAALEGDEVIAACDFNPLGVPSMAGLMFMRAVSELIDALPPG